MPIDVYQKLAQHLDNLPSGFPATAGGVEQRILRRLFTPEEAELALHLALLAEPARVVARRARIPVEEAARRLQEMERKGLIYATHDEGREPEYMATHWVVGIYEFQVGRLDLDLIRDLEAYWPAWVDQAAWDKVPQLRTIPIGESISVQADVMLYERAEELVRAQTRFAVAPCICRQERRLAGEGCDKPLEACLSMGSAATYYVRNGRGRAIDRAEALDILVLAEETGLVLQPGNSRDASNICACCGCCCGVLRNMKRYSKPASMISSPFQAVLDTAACTGCGACETRCQMEAIRLDGGHAVLDADRCIGCGLCVTTCPTQALALARKPHEAQPYVPRNIAETYIRLGMTRGKLTPAGLAKMLVRSKIDRLLAPR